MHISVIIPTCHRRQALLTLLQSLNCSSYPVSEVIIVDGGNNGLQPSDYEVFTQLDIRYLFSSASVCLQRNIGIRSARSPWIFLCDDDMEVPPDYLQKLAAHFAAHPEAGAVSGCVLQKEYGKWEASYPVQSPVELVWKFIFRLGIWGEITCKTNNRLIHKIKTYYHRRGNHLSPAGWPVITDLSGEYFIVPVYGLGASLIKKEWLLHSPYDEVLDSHGIGDHYGVATGFPVGGVHIVKNAVVYHHQSPVNRLQHPAQYFRRILALDYFIKKQSRLKHIKKGWLLWSLTGNLLLFLWARKGRMVKSSLQAIYAVASGRNPYCYVFKAEKHKAIQEPVTG